MGIALLTLSNLFQGFVRQQTPPETPDADRALRAARITLPSHRTTVRSYPMTSMCTQRPATLRVVRVRDEYSPAHEAGRMVIPGRMADVCAELDRLVAREAALHPAQVKH